MNYEAPLRCQQCGTIIKKKPQAKVPKYCTGCREQQQAVFKANLKEQRQRRARGV